MLTRLLQALVRTEVSAHCDLPCGVYDPAQARIEAESIKATIAKYHASDDEAFRSRALAVKEERSELVKHHLWVLWTDYFKAPHFEKYPQLHGLLQALPLQRGEELAHEEGVALRVLGHTYAACPVGESFDITPIWAGLQTLVETRVWAPSCRGRLPDRADLRQWLGLENQPRLRHLPRAVPAHPERPSPAGR